MAFDFAAIGLKLADQLGLTAPPVTSIVDVATSLATSLQAAAPVARAPQPAPVPTAPITQPPLLAAALPGGTLMNGFDTFPTGSEPAPLPTIGLDPTVQLILGGLNAVTSYRTSRDAAKASAASFNSVVHAPSMMSAPGMMPVGFPAMLGGGAILGGAARVGARAMTAVGLGGLLRGAARTRAVKLAKIIGIQAAATALGIGAVELAEAVLAEQAKRGRGRGVSAAQIRTTKRTMRKVMSLHRELVRACSGAGFPTRRRVAARAVCPPILIKK